ncbi:hypothetical protein [Ectopseudomonas composti]|uniref:hypothetical protein n=1 Tax=Ectopseudomonas composti TaxID=658457 RepID=UPI000773EEC3|nr:hypothetical protein [Pseudomonas composti]
MSIEKTIGEYRAIKADMRAIIDRHMQAAFSEIKQEFGDTPTAVGIQVMERHVVSEMYPSGVYAGCDVRLAGE